MISIPTARPHHIRNLENWFITYPYAIDVDEQHFGLKDGDLFPIKARPRAPLGTLLEQSGWLTASFDMKPKAGRAKSSSATYYSDTGLDYFVSILILIDGLCLLFGPVWWLSYVTTNSYRLAIITAFASFFTRRLLLAAGQRPFEILGASAPYAAVLMLYVQSNGANLDQLGKASGTCSLASIVRSRIINERYHVGPHRTHSRKCIPTALPLTSAVEALRQPLSDVLRTKFDAI